MTANQIYDTIEKAINTKTELTFTVKHGLGDTIPDTSFQAYILGNDTYQYAFTWGYLPGLNLYYKFMLDNIVLAKSTTKKYDVRDDACYQHAIEEEHFGRLVGFDNVYSQAARHATTAKFVIKKFVVTHGGQPNVFHVAANPGVNKTSGEKGFLAYGFKANLPTTPTDTKDAILLVDTLFQTEAEALKSGEKILKDKAKTTYSQFKKNQRK
jgi:hypothetical protein